MHMLLLLANSHAFPLRTHYFNRLLVNEYRLGNPANVARSGDAKPDADANAKASDSAAALMMVAEAYGHKDVAEFLRQQGGHE
jgi:hypothetical protein